jgi:hypothetical protein
MCSLFILLRIIQAALEIGVLHHFNYLSSVFGPKELLNPTHDRSARNQSQRKDPEIDMKQGQKKA